MSTILNYEEEVLSQAQNRRATVEFITIVNDLWYDKSIELVLFRNPLVDKRASEVLNLIDYAKEFVSKPISIQDALEIARAIQQIELPSSKLDIGKLAYECYLSPKKSADKIEFVKNKLKGATETKDIQPKGLTGHCGSIARCNVAHLKTPTTSRILSHKKAPPVTDGGFVDCVACCFTARKARRTSLPDSQEAVQRMVLCHWLFGSRHAGRRAHQNAAGFRAANRSRPRYPRAPAGRPDRAQPRASPRSGIRHRHCPANKSESNQTDRRTNEHPAGNHLKVCLRHTQNLRQTGRSTQLRGHRPADHRKSKRAPDRTSA